MVRASALQSADLSLICLNFEKVVTASVLGAQYERDKRVEEKLASLLIVSFG